MEVLETFAIVLYALVNGFIGGMYHEDKLIRAPYSWKEIAGLAVIFLIGLPLAIAAILIPKSWINKTTK